MVGMPLSGWLVEGVGWSAPFYFYGDSVFFLSYVILN